MLTNVERWLYFQQHHRETSLKVYLLKAYQKMHFNSN